jgi:mono/diheme cytochrome c family protein
LLNAKLVAATLLVALGGCSAPPLREPSTALTFATHCAGCHGERGAGDGPVAATLRGGVPNLRTLTARYGQFPAETIASYIDGGNMPPAHGSREMPVWGSVFDTTARIVPGARTSQQRVDALVAFLRELQVTER